MTERPCFKDRLRDALGTDEADEILLTFGLRWFTFGFFLGAAVGIILWEVTHGG